MSFEWSGILTNRGLRLQGAIGLTHATPGRWPQLWPCLRDSDHAPPQVHCEFRSVLTECASTDKTSSMTLS